MSNNQNDNQNVSFNSPKWGFWQVIIPAFLTAVTTILVTYLTVIKSDTKNSIKEADSVKQEDFSKAVAIIADGNAHQNTFENRLLVLGYCNATTTSKVIEVRIGETPDKMQVVTSESGTDRISVTFVVPPKWYYRISYDQVAGGGSDFSGWKL